MQIERQEQHLDDQQRRSRYEKQSGVGASEMSERDYIINARAQQDEQHAESDQGIVRRERDQDRDEQGTAMKLVASSAARKRSRAKACLSSASGYL